MIEYILIIVLNKLYESFYKKHFYLLSYSLFSNIHIFENQLFTLNIFPNVNPGV